MEKQLGKRLLDMLLYCLLMAALWWVLAGGSSSSWLVGVPVVLAAALAMLQWGRAWRLNLPGLARFSAYFLWASVRGGVDVARRVLLPALPIDPEQRRYPLRLPEGPARIFFTAVVSLLPGTLSLELERDELILHVLDARLPVDRELRRLETRVADVFTIDLPDSARGHDE
jgi:multicomponent Na+:H+ antiporter subunit E